MLSLDDLLFELQDDTENDYRIVTLKVSIYNNYEYFKRNNVPGASYDCYKYLFAICRDMSTIIALSGDYYAHWYAWIIEQLRHIYNLYRSCNNVDMQYNVRKLLDKVIRANNAYEERMQDYLQSFDR